MANPVADDANLVADVAERAARAAGEVALRGFRGPLEIRSKGGVDIVTQYDNLAEEAALEVIRAAFPDDHTLGEEGGRTGTGEGKARLWAIDPIDGTHNYAAQLPYWCSSVGVAGADGQILAAVVYDPLHGELFRASPAAGAYLNGSRIRASEVARLQDAFLVTDVGYGEAVAGRMMAIAEYIQPHVKRLRILGSAVLSLCYVACGRVDAYYHLSLQPWDLAAATLLIQEAGGTITDWQGEALPGGQSSAIAANSILHPRLLEALGDR
ncbi:MAG: inositol monophosphatase family protein [Chloroflexia bacterium]